MIQHLENRSSQISDFHLFKRINAIGEQDIVNHLFDANEIKGFRGQLPQSNKRRYGMTSKQMKLAFHKSSFKQKNPSASVTRHSLLSSTSKNQSLVNKRNLMISKSKNKSECMSASIVISSENDKKESTKHLKINTSQAFLKQASNSYLQSPNQTKNPQSTKNYRNIKKLEIMKGKLYEPRLDFEDFCDIEFKINGYPNFVFLFVYLVFGEDIFEYFIRYILRLDNPNMYFTYSNNYGLYLRKLNI